MRKYVRAVLSISTIGLLFYTLMDLRNQVQSLKTAQTHAAFHADSLTKVNDSLTNEVFIKSVELGRVEISASQVLSKYPKIYEEYHSFLYDSTE